jgi:hypothetical protein
MRSLLAFVNGESKVLPTAIDDALRTMEVVEAAYESNDHGGVGYVRMSLKNRSQNSSFKENCICR